MFVPLRGFAQSFDFAVDSLRVGGNIPGGYFEDFNNASPATTSPTSAISCLANVSVSGGFLILTSADGANNFTPDFLVDNCILGLNAPAFRLNRGSGNSVISASFRADLPLRGQQYGLQLFTFGTNELVNIQAGSNGTDTIVTATAQSASLSRVNKSVPVNLTGVSRITFRLAYIDDVTHRVTPSYSLDGGPFNEIALPQPGTVMTTGNQAVVSVVGSEQVSSGIGSTTCPPTCQGTAGEPISTGNGNYYYQHTDFVIPGRGMPSVFQRSYNSLDNYSGPLGINWTHSYNIVLTPSATSAFIKWGDGHGESFALSGTKYMPQPGVFSTLVKNADATFTLTAKNQTKYAFSVAGKLTTIQDKNGNTILLIYDGSGNLIRVTDTVGRALNLSYDTTNRITQIIDSSSRSVSFQYDTNNNLIQATDPAGGITTFTYDSNHRVISITLPNSQVLLQNTYDGTGRVISQTGGRGFSATLAYGAPNPGDTTITDARGNHTMHSYDSSLRIVKITDATGGMTSFTYDANNDRTSVTNQNGKITNLFYDSTGNVTGISDPLSNAIAFTYDAKNDLLTATNAKGKTTTFTYDVTGNLTAIKDALTNTTAFGYDGFGELVSKTDARGNSTTYIYDSLGNLTRITDALSHSTALNYDGIGRLASITDPNGNAATATYDALSRLVKINDPLGNQTQFAYDAVGNLLKIIDANGNATSYAYDATNNLANVTDALGHITRYAYDANNNRVTFTNAKSNATAYAYDALNRLSRITDPLSFATSYSYNPVGNVLAVTDAKGQTNQFTYDALNRLLTIAYADGKSVAYSYNANGNRVSMVDSHGTTTYAYDALDRLMSVTHPGAKVVTYAYDAVGNRRSLAYPDGKALTYSYDPSNRLSQVTDWLGRSTAYTYDAASNLLGTTYPNQAALAFAYDTANRLTEVRNTLRKGNDNDEDQNPIASFEYLLDAVGNRLQVTDGKGKVTRYTYDLLYELTSVSTGEEEGDKDDNKRVVRLTYDPVGNRLSLTSGKDTVQYSYDADDRLLTADTATFSYDANGNQISVARTTTSQPIIYRYDAANRLVSAAGGAINSTFAYDGDGNRITQSVGTGTYNYLNDVATALPVVLQESGPDGNISYAYGLGLISESSPPFDFFYHYDGLGSVVALTDQAGKLKAKYVYDAWGETLRSTAKIGTKNKFQFTGEALDPGTGLYYLRARYYDPSVSRFTSRDLLPVSAPFGANSYQYSFLNPIRYRDPAGLSAVETSQQLGQSSMLADASANLGSIWDYLVKHMVSIGAAAARVILIGANTETSVSPSGAVQSEVVPVSQVLVGLTQVELNTLEMQNATLPKAVDQLADQTTTVNQLASNFCLETNSYSLGGICAFPAKLKAVIIHIAEQRHITLSQSQIEGP